MTNVYSIDNLTKIYKGSKKKANDQISLSIQQGEIFGLLGPNGAGKSTLVHQMAGLTRPTSGSIRLFGYDVVKQPHIIPHYIALQTQQMMALRDLYAEEALYYTAQLRGLLSAQAHKQVKTLIEEFELGQFHHKRMRQLSGGQRRLMYLALAFVGDRPIQIFDEPTNDLDPVIRLRVWDKLLRLHREEKTLIIITHNVLEAERVIQRVGIINHGQLLAIGTIGELKARVDQRIRLELLLKHDGGRYLQQLSLLGEVRVFTAQHYIVFCQRDAISTVIDRVIGIIGIENLEDFHIKTPSLEDVYLQIEGTQHGK